MTIRKLRQRVRSLRDRPRLERELDVELQFHLDMLVAQNVRAGMTADEARRRARQTFGPVSGVKDDVRDAWLSRTIEMAVHDARYGLRMLAASPSFALGVILTIALAVGVNTAIFGTAYALLLKPLPFDEPQRLVVLEHGNDATGPMRSFSYPELTDYRRVLGADDIAELHTMWFILLGKSEPERVSTGVVSPNYFRLLGVQPLLGRTLLPSDDGPGAAPVLVLSFDYWMRAFDGDRSIVGRAFEMNDRAHTVVGVLPPFPSYPQPLDVYMPTSACPFRSRPEVAAGRTMRMSRAVVRMKDGVSLADFDADLERMAQHLRSRYPQTYADADADASAETAGMASGYRAIAIPLARDMRRALRPTLLLLLATAALVLLIACVSVSNLALSRLVHRAREVSLRAALGASRARLIRQLLTENVAVVVIGAAIGLLMAQAGLGTLTTFAQHATTLPVDSGITGPALAAAVGVTVILLLTSAVLPVVVRRRTLNGATPQPLAGRMRYRLVIGQVALSFVLTVAAAVSVRSLLHLQGIDVGFTTEHLQMMRLDLNFTKYGDFEAITKFWREFERRLSEVPGVAGAGGAGTVPLDGRPLSSSYFNVEGLNEKADGDIAAGGRSTDAAPSTTIASRANIRVATPGYFTALGQPLVAGRTFTRDDVDTRTPVAVVNETLARRYWPGGNVVGQRIRVAGLRPATVIGVVEDTRQRLDEPPGGEIYLPLLQTAQLSTHWLVRSRHPAGEVERRVRDVLRAIDPQQPVDNFRTLASLRDDSLLPSRVTASVVSLFSLLAILITATGIGGVLGYAVQQRRHEFGVRLALGAQRHRLVAMVVGDGLRLACIGLSLGGAVSLTMFPVMRSALTGVRRFDPASLLLVSILLLAVAAAACFVPARRAARVDPLLALRAD